MPAQSSAYDRMVGENDALRYLIARWRSHPEDAVELFGRASRMWRATAAAKHRTLYPAIQRQVPKRSAWVEAAVRENTHINGFLGTAERIAPGGDGFLEQVYEAAAAADGLLLHERRDIFPALRDDAWPGGGADRIVDEYLALRDRMYDELCDGQTVEERWARRGNTALRHGV
ncbi:hypothetical protein [Yinghuangia seranimata]|uniref:hypothetical protein n=1 Tax=Yinghuangia seranimata TaxID=408067 RepID=UPI00248C6E86|nr:hypothetical protein [Yinghuangia seranimata]MDI2125397.1 hypothetical protein [Yinghuangia seranimata]